MPLHVTLLRAVNLYLQAPHVNFRTGLTLSAGHDLKLKHLSYITACIMDKRELKLYISWLVNLKFKPNYYKLQIQP